MDKKPTAKVSDSQGSADVRTTLALGTWDNVKVYLLRDMIIPGIKKAILGAIQLFLFPDTKYTGTSVQTSQTGLFGKVSYSGAWAEKNNKPKAYGQTSAFNYSNLSFPTSQEAYGLLETLDLIIERYGQVSVSEMYEQCQLAAPAASENWGWKSTKGAEVIRVNDPNYPFILKMPKFGPLR